jgi:hypothetical protein
VIIVNLEPDDLIRSELKEGGWDKKTIDIERKKRQKDI